MIILFLDDDDESKISINNSFDWTLKNGHKFLKKKNQNNGNNVYIYEWIDCDPENIIVSSNTLKCVWLIIKRTKQYLTFDEIHNPHFFFKEIFFLMIISTFYDDDEQNWW